MLRKGPRSADSSHDLQLAPGVERREREVCGIPPRTLGGVGAPGTLLSVPMQHGLLIKRFSEAAAQVQPWVPSRCRYLRLPLPACAIHELETSLLGLYRVPEIAQVKQWHVAFAWTQHDMHAPEAAASGRVSTAQWEAALLPLWSGSKPWSGQWQQRRGESDSLSPVLE